MEKFKKMLVLKGIIYLILGIALIAISIMMSFDLIDIFDKEKDFAKGFAEGFSFGLGFAMAVLAIRNLVISKKEDKVKALYIRLNDEHEHLINYKASSMMMLIIIVGFALSMLIMVFINKVAFFTLFITFMSIMVLFSIIQLIYRKLA